MVSFNLNKAQQQKLRIFAVSILVSFIAWCVFALSNKYSYQVTAPVQYINSPEEKAFHPLQSDTVALNVEGSGWQILFSKLRLQPQVFKVDLSGLKRHNWVIFSAQLNSLNRQVSGNQRIVSVSPDTLYFDFSKQTIKKVPVNLISNLTFKKQYNIIHEIELEPAFVTVTGPSEDIKLIKKWDTELIELKDIDETISMAIALKDKERANINIYPPKVNLKIPVGEVTEKILEIPIRIENGKMGYSTTLLPGNVKVTVSVPLEYYADIKRSSFDIVVNLDESEFGSSNLPIKIIEKPDFCTILKIEPQNVDYILRK